MLDQRNHGAHARPAGRHEISSQRPLEHKPRLVRTGPRHNVRPVAPDNLHSLESHVQVPDARVCRSDVPPSRRAWAMVMARKRRYSLMAVVTAAVAVGSAGLSGAAPDGTAVRSALTETLAEIDDSPSTAEVVLTSAPVDVARNNSAIAKGAFFDHQRAIEEARNFRPLYAKYTSGVFTSGFGMRWGAMHGGVDVANSVGTPISAVGDGVIIKAGDAGDGYGISVKIRHTDGTITHYGHMSQALVTVGQNVLAGDQIGLMGSTGDSTGPHCHFEVFVGGDASSNRIDPLPWLASRGIDIGGLSD